MKVFVTVGSEKFPFDRLIRTIDKAVGKHTIPADTFIQTGHSHYLPKFCQWKSFLEFDKMVNFLQESEIIVSHAGVGSALLCLSLERIPLLFPRQSRFGEHIDDHQLDFARRMESQGKVLAAYKEEELIYGICHYQLLIHSLSMRPTPTDRAGLVTHLKKILR